MPGYRQNKFLTALDIVRFIKNWWTAWALRWRRGCRTNRMLRFRRGLNIVCRGGTRDWDVLQEVFFVGAYDLAMRHLAAQPGNPLVLDLGGNIGSFSLLAAHAHPSCVVRAFEPGPPNAEIFETNRQLNPALAERITLAREAVGGSTRETEWFFDETNPGGSSLFASGGRKYPVTIRAFTDVLDETSGDIALIKMDIEGAEYELVESLTPRHWLRLQALVAELHDDPRGRSHPEALLATFRQNGFTTEQEKCGCWLMRRDVKREA